MHNQLLQQIVSGVKLKSVKTNDRSRPILEGLRKFRRQLTIEEQMQKAEKAPVDEVVPDEMDDIDAVRDDLQSTKQMLAIELRNKEALERDNKRLQVSLVAHCAAQRSPTVRCKLWSCRNILDLDVSSRSHRSSRILENALTLEWP